MHRSLFVFIALLCCSALVQADHVELVAGGGSSPAPAPALNAQLNTPFGVDFDAEGRLWFVELQGHRIGRIENGQLTIPAGTGEKGFGGDGGPGPAATFNGMHNLAIGPAGEVFVSDTWNQRVRRLDPRTGIVTTFAGTGEKGFSGDGGPATQAKFGGIFCVSLDAPRHRLILTDLDNKRIRVVDLQTGIVTTIAGNGTRGVPVNGAKAIDSPLVDPRAAIADKEGRVYVLERGGHALRVVDVDGTIQTVVGTGTKGNTGDGGPGLEATMSGPKHLCLDRDGSIVIADTDNHVIRRYDPTTKLITRIAGTGQTGKTGIGAVPLQLDMNQPHGVYVHPRGDLYIADSYNHRILKVVRDSR